MLDGERQGTPIVMVGGLPRPVGVNYRLDPMLPLNMPVILYGEGGSGKSTFAAAIAVSVQSGIVVVEGFIPRRANVLYLDWEGDQDQINDRVRGVAAGAHVPEVVEFAIGHVSDRSVSRPRTSPGPSRSRRSGSWWSI